MVPLLRLLGIVSPVMLFASFCLLKVIIGGPLTNRPLQDLLVFLGMFLLLGSFIWMIYSFKAEEKDRHLNTAWERWKIRLKERRARSALAIMAFCKPIFCFLFSDRGPDDVVITRGPDAALFHLPHRWHPLEKTGPWLAVSLVVGPIILFATLLNTMALPMEQQDLLGRSVAVALLLAIMALILYKARIVWHYEIRLTSTTLQVIYHSTFSHAGDRVLDLGPVEQFTVVRCQNTCVLQAESRNGPPTILLRDRDYELLVRLAVRLADERKQLAPATPTLRVVAESALNGVQVAREQPPLNTKIVATRPDTGVSFEFPLAEDGRDAGRLRAWRLFEIGILLLLGAVIWYAVCSFVQQPAARGFAVLAFISGVFLLITAANQSWRTFGDNHCDEDLRQLAVVDNLLVRTTRDHRKQIWFRHEVDAILLEDEIQTQESHGEGGSTVVAVYYLLNLMVRLRSGEKASLAARSATYPLEDYRPRAELEWVATQLRQALFGDSALLPTEAADEKTALANAIQPANGRVAETHITE